MTRAADGLHAIGVLVCWACLHDIPGECHWPGCFFYLWRTDERPSLMLHRAALEESM